jgi:hypothetical protein
MSTKLKQVEELYQVKQYKIQYPISAYTFPDEARIQRVGFDDKYMRVEFTDGRELAVPLSWIPTLYNAAPEERAKYEINRHRTTIVWDPDKCSINDEVRIADYLGLGNGTNRLTGRKTMERREKYTARRRRARSKTASARR